MQAVVAGAGTALALYGINQIGPVQKLAVSSPMGYSAVKIGGIAAAGYLVKKKGMRDAGAALMGVAAYMLGSYAATKMPGAQLGAIPGYARAAFPQPTNTYYHLPNQMSGGQFGAAHMGAVGAELGAVGADLGAVHASLNGMGARVA